MNLISSQNTLNLISGGNNCIEILSIFAKETAKATTLAQQAQIDKAFTSIIQYYCTPAAETVAKFVVAGAIANAFFS